MLFMILMLFALLGVLLKPPLTQIMPSPISTGFHFPRLVAPLLAAAMGVIDVTATAGAALLDIQPGRRHCGHN